MNDPVSIDHLNSLDKKQFTELLADIFEHSPWVAEQSWTGLPIQSVAELHELMFTVLYNSSNDKKIALLRAHPELAGKAAVAGDLTDASTQEQKGAGLTELSPEEMQKITELNKQYGDKFGFPFIIAVKNHTKYSIFDAFERRLKNTKEEELETALEQVGHIAGFRLAAIFG